MGKRIRGSRGDWAKAKSENLRGQLLEDHSDAAIRLSSELAIKLPEITLDECIGLLATVDNSH